MLLVARYEAPELWIGHRSAFGMTTTALGTRSMRSWRGCGRSEPSTGTRMLGAVGSARSNPICQIGIEIQVVMFDLLRCSRRVGNSPVFASATPLRHFASHVPRLAGL